MDILQAYSRPRCSPAGRLGEVMTDVVWLLWNRALIDYAKVATLWLLARIHCDETAKQAPTSNHPAPDDRKSPKLDEFAQDANSAG